MTILRPSNENLFQTNKERLLRLKITIYQWLLRRLLRSYRQYAVYDVITDYDNSFRIVHERRDIAFEEELHRNGIDTRPQMLECGLPVQRKLCGSKCHQGYFKFKDLVSVYNGDKQIYIKRDVDLQVESTLSAAFKVSSANDIFCRTEIILDNVSEILESPINTDESKSKDSSVNVEYEPSYNTSLKGFEVDNDF